MKDPLMKKDILVEAKLAAKLAEIKKKWDERKPIERLCIVQESGVQLGPLSGRYERHIVEFIPQDDEEFGKQWCAKRNERTDLPYYLTKVEVKVIGQMELYTHKELADQNIPPLYPSYYPGDKLYGKSCNYIVLYSDSQESDTQEIVVVEYNGLRPEKNIPSITIPIAEVKDFLKR